MKVCRLTELNDDTSAELRQDREELWREVRLAGKSWKHVSAQHSSHLHSGNKHLKVVSLLSTDRRDAASGQTRRHIRMLLLQLLIRLSQITQNLFVLVLM